MDDKCEIIFDEDPTPVPPLDPLTHPLQYFFNNPETLEVPTP